MKKIGAILLVAAMVIMMMPISVSAAWEASKNAYAYTSSDVSNTIVGGDSIADLTTTGLDTIYVSAAETLAAAPQDNTTYIVDGVALTLADAAIPTGTKFVTINGGTVVVPNAQSPISSTVTTTGNVTVSYGDSTATVDKGLMQTPLLARWER